MELAIPPMSSEEEAFLRKNGVVVDMAPVGVRLALKPAETAAVLAEWAERQHTRDTQSLESADMDAALGRLIHDLSQLGEAHRNALLDAFHPGALLESLARRGGTLKACADAQLLCLRKSADYNQTGGGAGTFSASLDDYFPFGLKSYAQMLHTKSQRLVSLALKGEAAGFEGPRDTMLDLINYASFGADWLYREEQAHISRACGEEQQ